MFYIVIQANHNTKTGVLQNLIIVALKSLFEFVQNFQM